MIDKGAQQMRRKVVLAAAASLAWPWSSARAQAYPSRPIRIVVPAPPGSVPDLMARLYANEMQADLGQPVVVDNKPGAAGGLGAADVARSAPDGYSVLFVVDTIMTVNPLIYSHLSYDPARDFKPVSMLGKTGGVIAVNPSLGVKTLPELVRLAQSQPNAINYGSGGSGHSTHLGTELLLQAANIKMTHIAYRGTPLAVQDAIAGQVGLVFTGYVEALPHVKSGRLIALATTGQAAKTIFPDVPEVKEYYPNFDFEACFALLVPAATTDAIVQRLHQAVAKATQNSVVKQKLIEVGIVAYASKPAEVTAFMQSNSQKFAPLIKTLGLKVD